MQKEQKKYGEEYNGNKIMELEWNHCYIVPGEEMDLTWLGLGLLNL